MTITQIESLKQEIDNWQIMYDDLRKQMKDYYDKRLELLEKAKIIDQIIEAKYKEIELIKKYKEIELIKSGVI